jgi:hypothetical protein
MLASVEAIVWAAPLAFLLGLGAGLALSSRFRIVKRPDDDRAPPEA